MDAPKILALPVLLLIIGCTTQNSFNSLLRDYHYVEVRPPTTLWPPGSVVIVRERDPVVLEVVCKSQDFLGSHLTFNTSNSTTSELARKASSTFNMDASYLDQLKASGKYTEVQDVKLTYSNVKIIELDRGTIFDNLKNRQPGCSQALEDADNSKEIMSFVSSVLQADVVMRAEFSREFTGNAQAKSAILDNLAAEFGVNTTSSDKSSVQGNALFWGIRELPHIAQLDANGKIRPKVIRASLSDDGREIENAAVAAAKKTNGTLVAYSSPSHANAAANYQEASIARREYKERMNQSSTFAMTTTPGPSGFDDRRTVSSFIGINAENILADLSKGDGEYIRSLATLLEVSSDNQEAFRAEMRETLFLDKMSNRKSF